METICNEPRVLRLDGPYNDGLDSENVQTIFVFSHGTYASCTQQVVDTPPHIALQEVRSAATGFPGKIHDTIYHSGHPVNHVVR